MVSELIIDETPLTEPFIPERLLHREGVIKEIASALSPVLKERSADNLLIYGESGTGKTSVIKNILENHFKDSSVYVNCWNVNTRAQGGTLVLLPQTRYELKMRITKEEYRGLLKLPPATVMELSLRV